MLRVIGAVVGATAIGVGAAAIALAAAVVRTTSVAATADRLTLGAGQPNQQTQVPVTTTAAFRAALAEARPGHVILLAPGTYEGGSYRRELKGTAVAPIVIAGADPTRPPVISGGTTGITLSDAAYVVIRDVIVERVSENGINIDDGESFETPSHHITISGVTVREITAGNHDGLKLSGVTDSVVEDSHIERWGDSGSAIDMVGCHRIVVRRNVFRHTPGMRVGNGVQAKGGSRQITVADNRFEFAAARGVQVGGDTGLSFFRPQPPGHAEASDVVIERNVFIGGETPVAFVSSEGGVFRFNTASSPTHYLLRILRENKSPDFVDTRDGEITDNVFYWTGPLVVNIGPGTASSSFRFARNGWYRADDPASSRPLLPSAEIGGVYGVDPQFLDAAQDLHTRTASPRGAFAPRVP